MGILKRHASGLWSRHAFSCVLSLSAWTLLAACEKPAPKVEPENAVVGVRPAEALTSKTLADSAPEYIAAVKANEETDFSFKVGGILELVGPEPNKSWEEGVRVKSGSVLARLHQSDFKNAVISAKASSNLAGINLDRISKLLAGSAVSKQEGDKAKADAEMANARLEDADQNLKDSELVAPWDGVVFARYVNAGETVAAGKPVLRFGDVATMSVELGVPDRMVGRFAVGKEIDVDVSALAGRPPFRGKITEVGVAASREGRLYRVVIKVPNPDGILKSGMTAAVRAGELLDPAPGQVLIPLSALIAPAAAESLGNRPGTQLAVFVIRDGKAALRKVRTGDIIASSIIVSEGLADGEPVVTRGTSQLYDGAPVTVR